MHFIVNGIQFTYQWFELAAIVLGLVGGFIGLNKKVPAKVQLRLCSVLMVAQGLCMLKSVHWL
jgi:hypothetical protein